MEAKASNDSVSEDDQGNFNFETLNIGEESCKYRTLRSDDTEVPETGMEAGKELYKMIHLINPTKKKNIYITHLY